MINEFHTIFMDLPPSVKGMVVRSFDNEEYYTIVLNARYNAEQQLMAYQHEVEHILHHDFDGYCDTDIVEKERHVRWP